MSHQQHFKYKWSTNIHGNSLPFSLRNIYLLKWNQHTSYNCLLDFGGSKETKSILWWCLSPPSPGLLYHFRCTLRGFYQNCWVMKRPLTTPALGVKDLWPYQGLLHDTGGNSTGWKRNISCLTNMGNHQSYPDSLKTFSTWISPHGMVPFLLEF